MFILTEEALQLSYLNYPIGPFESLGDDTKEALRRIYKWDLRFLDMAKFISSWSKDPSTPMGAVIVRPDRSVVSVGYNGFARGVKDTPERWNHRETKYAMVVHGERNALLFAKQDMTGCTLYTWPLMPCSVCAGMVIQAGISRVVSPRQPQSPLGRVF